MTYVHYNEPRPISETEKRQLKAAKLPREHSAPPHSAPGPLLPNQLMVLPSKYPGLMKRRKRRPK
jgi:hypothetical protein